jgi:hypothetical protein
LDADHPEMGGGPFCTPIHNHELELGRLSDRHIGGLLAAKDFVRKIAASRQHAGAASDQAAKLHEAIQPRNGRQSMLEPECGDPLAHGNELGRCEHGYCVSALLYDCLERLFHVLGRLHLDPDNGDAKGVRRAISLAQLLGSIGTIGPQHGHMGEVGYDFSQHLQPFGAHLRSKDAL